MKTKFGKILVLLVVTSALFAAAVPCRAADVFADDDVFTQANPGHKRKGGELTEEQIERIMNRLNKADPEKAEQLLQLRKKDPQQFKLELRRTIREKFAKKNMEHRRQANERRSRRRQPGSGFDECPMGKGSRMGMRGREGGRREMGMQGHEGRRPKGGGGGVKGKKYGKHKEDPKLAEARKEKLELDKKRDGLLKKIRAADDKEKPELVKQLEDVLSAKYDIIVKRKQIAYEHMLKKLAKLKTQVEKSEAKVSELKDVEYKNKNVKNRLEELLNKAEGFKWE